jgi:hypothetical protein
MLVCTAPFISARALILCHSILAAVYGQEKMPPNNRTTMMVITTLPTVLGFALIAFVKNKGARLFGYCKLILL